MEVKRSITSILTIPHKYVFPAITGVGGLIALAVGAESVLSHESIADLLLPFLIAPALFFASYQGARLKFVSMDAGHLYISDFRRIITVPRPNIKQVSSWILWNPETIRIDFREATEFGTSVYFLPTFRILGMFTRHPIVKELVKLPPP